MLSFCIGQLFLPKPALICLQATPLSPMELFQEIQRVDENFKTIAKSVPSPSSNVDEIFSSARFDNRLATPPPSSWKYKDRYAESEVEDFFTKYRRTLVTGSHSEIRPGLPNVLKRLIENRLAELRSRAFSAVSENVICQFIDQPRQTIGVRRSYTDQDIFIIDVGTQFLQQVDDLSLRLAFALFFNFQQKHTGFATEGSRTEDFVNVAAFLNAATQLNAQNLDSKIFSEAGGAPKPEMAIMLGQLAAIHALKSPNIPDDLKKAILFGEGFSGADDIKLPSYSEAVTLYPHNIYIFSLHYYILRDIVSYLLAHEISHVAGVAHGKVAGGVASEIAADQAAVRALEQLGDTDPHSLILAMAVFHRNLLQSHNQDPDHPFTPQRLDILYRALENQYPSMFLDVESGENLLVTPVSADQHPGILTVEFSYSLRHAVRFHLKFDEVVARREPQYVVLDASVTLRPVDPESNLSKQARFIGPIRLDDIFTSPTPTSTRMTAVAELSLPGELWTSCFDCTMHIDRLSFLPSTPKQHGWVLEDQPVTEMTSALEKTPPWQRPYELLFLARDLYQRGRSADSANVYKLATVADQHVLAPADWLRWASVLTGDLPKLVEVMDAAKDAYPQTASLHYLDAVANNLAGNNLAALDSYFYEQYGIDDSTLNADLRKDANLQMIRIMAEAKPETDESTYAEGMKYYIVAQALGPRIESSFLYSQAAEKFHSLAARSFSSELYEAETLMYETMVMPIHHFEKPRELFVELIKRDPAFMPSYGHMFDMAACDKNLPEAKQWLIAAIRYNPTQMHPMIGTRLQALDRNALGHACGGEHVR